MGKTALLFLPLLLIGCDKTYDEIIDPSHNNYQAYSVSPVDSIRYVLEDSLVTFRINFSLNSSVGDVYCSVTASDGSRITDKYLQLYDNGNSANGDNIPNDKIYSNKLPLSKYYPNGYYTTKYYVQEQDNELRQIATGKFKYNNGQDNEVPIVSNLQMPDSIQAGETIVFSVDVSDGNGLNDIESVYYQTYNPNGELIVNSQGISKFPLFDDGKTSENGDVTAGDGKFTVTLTFPSSAQHGIWRFVFQARDRSGVLSNTIDHNILIQ